LGQAAEAASDERAGPLGPALARIERRSGGLLGVQVVHTGSGRRWGWRGDERFPMCSSFKLPLAGMALRQAATGALRLDERLAFGPSDLMHWSPVTEGLLAEGSLTLAELCAATLATSDNTAANLVLARLGGPPAFTAFMRGLGDAVTRLDRAEPAMNAPHPFWDSSSPRAMAHSLQALLLGDALPPPQQAQLKAWLLASVTGRHRLRAGLPAGWAIASKTGTSDHGSTNDLGVVWPAGGAPIVVVAFIRGSRAGYAQREAALAEVARLVARTALGPAA
jgi:beta-lactamase class A